MTVPRRSSRAREEILRYLDSHGVVNKDQGRTPRNRNATGKGTFSLDLHGYTQEQAAVKLRTTISRCRHRGIRTLLVVHGQGYHSHPDEGPVLKKMVRDMLQGELESIVADWKPGAPSQGGDGATVVRLR